MPSISEYGQVNSTNVDLVRKIDFYDLKTGLRCEGCHSPCCISTRLHNFKRGCISCRKGQYRRYTTLVNFWVSYIRFTLLTAYCRQTLFNRQIRVGVLTLWQSTKPRGVMVYLMNISSQGYELKQNIIWRTVIPIKIYINIFYISVREKNTGIETTKAWINWATVKSRCLCRQNFPRKTNQSRFLQKFTKFRKKLGVSYTHLCYLCAIYWFFL